MHHAQIWGRLSAWRRRHSAWGARLDEQHILLASLVVQANGSVRVAAFEHQHAPVGPWPPDARDAWLVEQLHGVGAGRPRRERSLALALHTSRCRQGVYTPPPGLAPAQCLADVRLEAAQALGTVPEDVGFDVALPSGADPQPGVVHWAACRREDLQRWLGHARRAGWRLPVVEPEHQAARRAAQRLRGDAHRAQSPQDWLFERSTTHTLDEGQWEALQASPQWGALVACGAALGLLP